MEKRTFLYVDWIKSYEFVSKPPCSGFSSNLGFLAAHYSKTKNPRGKQKSTCTIFYGCSKLYQLWSKSKGVTNMAVLIWYGMTRSEKAVFGIKTYGSYNCKSVQIYRLLITSKPHWVNALEITSFSDGDIWCTNF
jgi:hypothetical protein